MQMDATASKLMGRRLTGALLHALLLPGLALSIAAPIAGLRGSGILLAMLATVALLTLSNLDFGRRPAYARFWGSESSRSLGFSPRLFDDALTSREKLGIVLTSGFGVAWLALDFLWLAFAVNDLFS
jgi:hypothetical protein